MKLRERYVRIFSDGGIALAAAIWGGNYVLIKYALKIMPAMYYLGTRFTLAFLLLGVFVTGRLRRLTASQFLLAAGVGAILFVGFCLYTAGLARTTPGISGFLTTLYVVLIPLFLGLWTRRWPSWMVWMGIAVIVCGIALLTVSGRLHFGWGEILTLIGTVFWAFHIIGVGYAAPRMDSFALTGVQLGAVGFLGLVATLIFESPPAFPGWGGVTAIVYTAVMGGIVGYFLMAHGQRHTPTTLAGIYVSFEAVWSLVVSVIVGYDHIVPRNIFGFALIFAGTVLAQVGSRQTVRAAPIEEVEVGPPI